MTTIAVFMDVSNLYHCLKHGRKAKLDYAAFLRYISDFGKVTVAYAYGASRDGNADTFKQMLQDAGYIVKYKKLKEMHNDRGITHKADCDVLIALDVCDVVNSRLANLIIIGSADGDMAPVVEWAKDNGVKVIVCASNISYELKEAGATCIEVPPSLYYGATQDTAKRELCDSSSTVYHAGTGRSIDAPVPATVEPLETAIQSANTGTTVSD